MRDILKNRIGDTVTIFITDKISHTGVLLGYGQQFSTKGFEKFTILYFKDKAINLESEEFVVASIKIKVLETRIVLFEKDFLTSLTDYFKRFDTAW